MPKVVREYKDQARARIVEAASEVFRRKGLSGATMEDVAREIGVSKGALYLYFPSKAQLLNALLQRSRERAMRQLEPLLVSGDVAEGIASTIDHVFSGEVSPAVWNELLAGAGGDPEVREALRRDQESDLHIVRGFLRRLEARHRIPPMADANVTADAILLLLMGTVAQIAQRGKPVDYRHKLERALRLLLGLPVRPSRPVSNRLKRQAARADKDR